MHPWRIEVPQNGRDRAAFAASIDTDESGIAAAYRPALNEDYSQLAA
jgi:hypothetical protein